MDNTRPLCGIMWEQRLGLEQTHLCSEHAEPWHVFQLLSERLGAKRVDATKHPTIPNNVYQIPATKNNVDEYDSMAHGEANGVCVEIACCPNLLSRLIQKKNQPRIQRCMKYE